MARKNRLKELEAAHGDLEALIVPYVNKAGQGEAARLLDVSQATVSTFLKHKGYTPVTVYVKTGQIVSVMEGEADGHQAEPVTA